jgi:hypothetical protein
MMVPLNGITTYTSRNRISMGHPSVLTVLGCIEQVRNHEVVVLV